MPIGMLGGCCWLRGKVAAAELDALGEDKLAGRLYDDQTAEEARALGDELAAAADRIEARHDTDGPKPQGAGSDGRWDAERGEIVWETRTSLEEAITEIRKAAAWYRKVGELGFGVHAWF